MEQITVIGSLNLDTILYMDEVPTEGQSIYINGSEKRCGGKGANSATAVAKLGNHTLFYGCVGKDEEGETLLSNLSASGINVQHIQKKTEKTGVAYICIEKDGGNRIMVSPGANEAITAEDIRNKVMPLIEKSGIVLMQLEITPVAIETVVDICQQLGKKLVIDAGPIRGITAKQLANTFCVSPNESELEALVGYSVKDDDAVIRGAEELHEKYNIENVVVKLGGRGAYCKNSQQSFFMPAYDVPVVDTTAAGDSFMAGLCTALINKKTIKEAVEYGNKCGAIAVTRKGSSDSVPSKQDIENFEFIQKQ